MDGVVGNVILGSLLMSSSIYERQGILIPMAAVKSAEGLLTESPGKMSALEAGWLHCIFKWLHNISCVVSLIVNLIMIWALQILIMAYNSERIIWCSCQPEWFMENKCAFLCGTIGEFVIIVYAVLLTFDRTTILFHSCSSHIYVCISHWYNLTAKSLYTLESLRT